MIQAAPFILPLAEALGLSVATLGMAKVTDEVNKYVQENPVKLISPFDSISVS